MAPSSTSCGRASCTRAWLPNADTQPAQEQMETLPEQASWRSSSPASKHGPFLHCPPPRAPRRWPCSSEQGCCHHDPRSPWPTGLQAGAPPQEPKTQAPGVDSPLTRCLLLCRAACAREPGCGRPESRQAARPGSDGPCGPWLPQSQSLRATAGSSQAGHEGLPAPPISFLGTSAGQGPMRHAAQS